MQQNLSIIIRKLRYGFEPLKFIHISTAKTMKGIYYVNLKEEIKIHTSKINCLSSKEKESFHGLTPKDDTEVQKDLYEPLKIFSTENQYEFFNFDEELNYHSQRTNMRRGSILFGGSSNKIAKKDNIVIDGQNYLFKHVSSIISNII